MKKFLVTFWASSYFKNKCVVVESESEEDARRYIYKKYGIESIAFFRNYNENKNLIKQYNLEVIKERV